MITLTLLPALQINPPLDCMVVPTDPFNSEARNAFHLMLDANQDVTCEQVFLMGEAAVDQTASQGRFHSEDQRIRCSTD